MQPASLTLMAGPIDVRIAPNKVNKLANDKPLKWFRDNLIGTVPWKFAGPRPAGLSRLPAALRLHEHERRAPLKAVPRPVQARVDGDDDKADAIKEFYKEYFAIMDMTADFYLETIDQVFQRCLLPKGEMMFKGRKIDPRAIKQDLPADGRGREGRHLLGRPDARRARPVFGPAPLHEDPPSASRRRPLRRVQRQDVGHADLSGRAQPYPGEFVRVSRVWSGGALAAEPCVRFSSRPSAATAPPLGFSTVAPKLHARVWGEPSFAASW